MVFDEASDSTASPTLSPTLDAPPSYDAITSPPPEASSSTQQDALFLSSTPHQPPKDTLHLFSGPPNPEPLLGRLDTPLDVLNSIETSTKWGWITSHDYRLQNPTTLYDFIRHQSLNVPRFVVKCSGVHFETPERDEVVHDRDGPRQRKKGQTERIVDFEFTIDLTPILSHTDNFANVHLSTVADDVATDRGTHAKTFSSAYAPASPHSGPAFLQHPALRNVVGQVSREYASIDESTLPGRAASRSETRQMKEWETWRDARGLPPWASRRDWKEFIDRKGKSTSSAPSGSGASEEGRVALLGDDEAGDAGDEEREVRGRESKVSQEAKLKAWCEAFCADQGWLKEFRVPFGVWGWDLDGLTAAIKGAITSTGYNSNHITVTFETSTKGLVVLTPNLLSKALNKTWVYVLMWITLIAPLIWLWQRLSPSGGATYTVARTTYGLKFYPALPSTFPGETIASAQERLGGMYKIHRELPKPTQLAPGPKGIHYLLGRKEGEWFREWEERIRMGVRMRYRGELVGGGEEEAGVGLDGY